MWDVKIVSFFACHIHFVMFYLNYVGCKASKLKSTLEPENVFYLNYVGCKETIVDIGNGWFLRFTLTMWDVKEDSELLVLANCPGFTLTMWDVKTTSEFLIRRRLEFYLNYVGCKESRRNSGQSSKSGFTLTMWDVKRVKLTNLTHDIEFYLNYVGCKATLYFKRSGSSFGFTLTMWDVKF